MGGRVRRVRSGGAPWVAACDATGDTRHVCRLVWKEETDACCVLSWNNCGARVVSLCHGGGAMLRTCRPTPAPHEHWSFHRVGVSEPCSGRVCSETSQGHVIRLLGHCREQDQARLPPTRPCIPNDTHIYTLLALQDMQCIALRQGNTTFIHPHSLMALSAGFYESWSRCPQSPTLMRFPACGWSCCRSKTCPYRLLTAFYPDQGLLTGWDHRGRRCFLCLSQQRAVACMRFPSPTHPHPLSGLSPHLCLQQAQPAIVDDLRDSNEPRPAPTEFRAQTLH